MSAFLFIILTILFVVDIIPKLRSADLSAIWQPTSFMIVYLSYYVIVPFLKRDTDASDNAQTLLLCGTLLFFIVYKWVYNNSNPHIRFSQLNKLFDSENAVKIAVTLFVISFLCYGSFNGFRLSVLSTTSLEEVTFDENGSYGHTDMYVTYLISVFAFSCAVVYAVKQKISPTLGGMLVLSMIIYIIGGFRYRILLLFVTIYVAIHLYPKPRKIKYYILIPLFGGIYFLMGIMERTRTYGKGLDIEALTEIQRTKEVNEANENKMVYEFSAACMERYGVEDYVYFEPIITALLMPIPRKIFPWKPKGTYMREANIKIYNTINHGNAFLNITEAYVSFGWLGIIFYAWFLGWLSKVFWNNYCYNRESLPAVLLIALFNATLYQIVARGYMAGALTTFVYYVFVPFWIILLLREIKLLVV